MDDNLLNMILPNHSFEINAKHHLITFLNNLNEDDKEVSNIILSLKKNIIKLLSGNKIVNEEDAIKAIVETKHIINKSKQNVNEIKSFRELLIDSEDMHEKNSLLTLTTKNLIKYEFLYNFSIVYIDSFIDVPKTHKFNKHNDKFNAFTEFNTIIKNTPINYQMPFFPDSIEKSKMFENHLQIVRYFIYLHPKFRNPLNNTKNAIPVYGLDSLEGSNKTIVILGILLISEEGKPQIQDERTRITLDINSCTWDKAYFTPGSVILCEGIYRDKVFYAEFILQPPCPKKFTSFVEKIENDIFGVVGKIMKKYDNTEETNNNMENFIKKGNFTSQIKSTIFPVAYHRLLQQYHDNLQVNYSNSKINEDLFTKSKNLLLENNQDIVIINNINLGDYLIMKELKVMLNKFESGPPAMFILIGGFLPDSSFDSFTNQSTYFENLATLIAEHKEINNNSIFCFIPGGDDIKITSAFPISPLPDYLIEILSKKVKHVIPASNPCRFSIFGKEFVFFRDDLHKKLARNAIGILESHDKQKYYLNTIFGQGNLLPLSQDKSLKLWNLSNSLLFIPPPDYLIIADKTENFVEQMNESVFINPGNFSKDTSFIYLSPLTGEIQQCKIKE